MAQGRDRDRGRAGRRRPSRVGAGLQPACGPDNQRRDHRCAPRRTGRSNRTCGDAHVKTGSRALDDLFWRDEILQIAYWYGGEGFGDAVTARDLRRFLADDAPDLAPYLAHMARD